VIHFRIVTSETINFYQAEKATSCEVLHPESKGIPSFEERNHIQELSSKINGGVNPVFCTTHIDIELTFRPRNSLFSSMHSSNKIKRAHLLLIINIENKKYNTSQFNPFKNILFFMMRKANLRLAQAH
jgi:hypothetical protein